MPRLFARFGSTSFRSTGSPFGPPRGSLGGFADLFPASSPPGRSQCFHSITSERSFGALSPDLLAVRQGKSADAVRSGSERNPIPDGWLSTMSVHVLLREEPPCTPRAKVGSMTGRWGRLTVVALRNCSQMAAEESIRFRTASYRRSGDSGAFEIQPESRHRGTYRTFLWSLGCIVAKS